MTKFWASWNEIDCLQPVTDDQDSEVTAAVVKPPHHNVAMVKKLKLERIDPGTEAEKFFTNFVSKRKPVVLTGLLDDPAFKGKQWVWSIT